MLQSTPLLVALVGVILHEGSHGTETPTSAPAVGGDAATFLGGFLLVGALVAVGWYLANYR